MLHRIIKFGCALLNGGNPYVQRELLKEMQSMQDVNCLGESSNDYLALFHDRSCFNFACFLWGFFFAFLYFDMLGF